jgi:predicted PurR-regulated permease PerM
MELLRNLFGNVTSGIIRLGVAVGIIAAVGFFIVKPVLHSSDNAFNSVNEALKESGINDVSKTINTTSRRVQRQIQRQINHSFRISTKTGNSEKLVRCIQRAQPNVEKIQRCTLKY